MERLTEYEVVGGHVHAVPTGDVDQAMMRLAAYEDSGFTPAEIKSLYAEWDVMMSVLNSIGGGYERLRELAEAEKEGRVVVLPCKDWLDVVFEDQVLFWGIDRDYMERQI